MALKFFCVILATCVAMSLAIQHIDLRNIINDNEPANRDILMCNMDEARIANVVVGSSAVVACQNGVQRTMMCILGYSFDSNLTSYQVNAQHLAQHFQHIAHEYFDTVISGLFLDEEPTTRDCFYANQLFVNQGNSDILGKVRIYFDEVAKQANTVAPAAQEDSSFFDFDDNAVPNYPIHGDVETCNIAIRTGPTYRTHGNSLHLCMNKNEMAVLTCSPETDPQTYPKHRGLLCPTVDYNSLEKSMETQDAQDIPEDVKRFTRFYLAYDPQKSCDEILAQAKFNTSEDMKPCFQLGFNDLYYTKPIEETGTSATFSSTMAPLTA